MCVSEVHMYVCFSLLCTVRPSCLKYHCVALAIVLWCAVSSASLAVSLLNLNYWSIGYWSTSKVALIDSDLFIAHM